jgi:hypothetical protein
MMEDTEPRDRDELSEEGMEPLAEEEEMEEDMGLEDEENEGDFLEKSDDGQDDHDRFSRP